MLTPHVATRDRLITIQTKIQRLKILEKKEECQGSLRAFVEYFWPVVDPSPFMSFWGIDAICDHLEAVMLGHISNLLINIPPRCSKPVWEEEFVIERTRGRIPLREVLVGDQVVTASGGFGRVSAVHLQGELPLYKLTEECGRTLRTAGDHPILTTRGWVEMSKVVEGDHIGLVSPTGSCDGVGVLDEDARLLGYLIGDGSLVSGIQPRVTTISEEVSADVIFCAEKLGFYTRRQEQKTRKCWDIIIKSSPTRWSVRRDGPAPFRVWLDKYDLVGKSSYTKRVPEQILASSKSTIANFLGAYWSCDGYVAGRGSRRDGAERGDCLVGCDSVSRELLLDIQHLLLRLGIFSRLRKKTTKLTTKRQPGGLYVSYNLTLSRQDDVAKFANLIPIVHKKSDRLAQLKNRTDFDRATQSSCVLSVEKDGYGFCRCLTVEGGSPTFTANDIAVHNTTIVSIMFPAFVWLRDHDIGPLSGPQVRFLCSSYSDKLTLLASTAFRRLVQSEQYSAMCPDLRFTMDQNSKSHMDNNKRGSRQSTSVGGGLLGLGGDILIADDLNNTETEKLVETGADREKTKSFFDEFRSTRRNDPREGRSAVVGVQQRTNREDMSGHWLTKCHESGEEIVHLCIPMRNDPERRMSTVVLPQYDDPMPWTDPRDPDSEDLMWPERFGEKEVRKLERNLGPIAAAGRLQQSPKAKGGNIILADYWKLWDEAAARTYDLIWDNDLQQMPPTELVVASLDTAQKEKEENDYNALTIWGIWQDRGRIRRAMLMYAWKGRVPLNGVDVKPYVDEAPAMFERRKKAAWGLVQHVAFYCKKYRVKRLLVEDKTRGHDVANEIRRQYAWENWGVQLLNPVQDKVSRAHVTVPLFTDGSIWAPAKTWSEAVIEECENFPKGKFDDYVDSVTQFVNWARQSGLLGMTSEAEAEELEHMEYKGKQAGVSEQYGV